jgi:hypothetical protein
MDTLLSWWRALPEAARRAAYVAAAVLTVLVVIRYVWASNNINPSSRLAGMVRQAARWGAAAEQDGSLLMGLTHANYAAAYMQVLRELHGDAALADACAPFPGLQAKIDDIQVRLQRAAAGACPGLQPASHLEASTLL